MNESTSSWSVVATVDEPPAVIQMFVAWYLSLGASQVYLYFDRPDDPGAKAFDDHPNVAVVVCDTAHWQRLGRARPDKHQIRQVRNATDAYRRMATEWLLHVDADEYLWPAMPVGRALERIYPWTHSAIVPVAERVFCPQDRGKTLYEGAFRRPFVGRDLDAQRLFGADYGLTLRGLTGHAVGKSFTRRGANMVVSIHRPKLNGPGVLQSEPARGLSLLHFEGLTPLHWVFKLLRKADAFAHKNGMQPTVHRQRQIEAIMDDPSAAMALHDRLKRIDNTQRDVLLKRGLLDQTVFDPHVALRQFFPRQAADLSADAFDQWLWQRYGDMLAQAGLRPGS